MPATTLRLPAELKAETDAYAARLGISVNALAAVALREYLDDRAMRRSGGLSEIPRAVAEKPPAETPVYTSNQVPSPAPVAVKLAPKTYVAPKSPSDPCPCGARRPDGTRRKWKHCHGLPSGA